jgi:predicted site-specific integrase-resolvase
MAKLGVVAAANAAGVSRATINRYLKSGKLSATTDRHKQRVIDTAELSRLFGDLQPAATSRNGRKQPLQQPIETVAMLQQQVAALERENATLRRELDAARDEKARLLALVEKGQQRLLTDQRSGDGAVSRAVRWLFGDAP